MAALSTQVLAAKRAFVDTRKYSKMSCVGTLGQVPILNLRSPFFTEHKIKEIEPGLLVLLDQGGAIDLADPSELRVAISYAKILSKNKETLLLIPKYRGIAVPGFDGIIFKENLQAIANVSIKVPSKLSNMSSNITVACKQAIAASIEESSWLGAFGDLSGGQTWRPIAQNLFGVKLGEYARSTRVVVEMPSWQIPTSSKFYRDFQKRIVTSQGLIESIIIIGRNGYIEMRANSIDLHLQ